ncbi:ABC1 kinase family protein [Amycolatopsis sp. cmx-11-12]|uniref:ABC1 kinase family protein n=1 Tax=Amycolatopsis sp. cmx-11-12 TaxID=2785795 RepID=UPI0039183598
MPDIPVSRWRLFTRFVTIVAVLLGSGFVVLLLMLGGFVTGGPKRAKRMAYRGFVRTLQILGPTFVKFGQTSSTRRDTMPAALCDELSTLHDSVRPMSRRKAARALREADIEGLEVAPDPSASGSIACVYRGELPDGRVVAVKLKRPGIEGRMRADLALTRSMVRRMEKMPKMRGMPMADLVGYISTAILGQLDFAREARNIARLRQCLSEIPQIRVPAVYPELSTADCLLFEYLPQLDTATPEALPTDVRATLAKRTLEAANRMMFAEGFVHCDLHPGNVYLTRDQRVVILDAGYCVQLPERVRELIGEFFSCLALGDGDRCGEIVLESAVDPGEVDRAAFVAETAAIVAEHAGPDVEFDMKVFGDKVFQLQQKHGIYTASDFAFPLMSLTVLDGTIRRLSEEADFQQVGVARGGREWR